MPSKNLNKNNLQLIRHNTALVKKLYPNITQTRIQALRDLTRQFSFSFASGDVIQLENGWFVTHTGLVRLARRKRCRGIHVEAVDSLCDAGRIVSCSKRLCIRPKIPPVSSATAMPTLLMFLWWSAAPRCGCRLTLRAVLTGSSSWFLTTSHGPPFGRFPAVARGKVLRLWPRPLFLHPTWTRQRRAGSFSFRPWRSIYAPSSREKQ
jgi:hypothetical protein